MAFLKHWNRAEHWRLMHAFIWIWFRVLCYMMSAFDEELIPEFKKFASLVASNLCKISESSVWGWNQVKRAIFSLKQHLQTALCVLNQVSFIIYSKNVTINVQTADHFHSTKTLQINGGFRLDLIRSFMF